MLIRGVIDDQLGDDAQAALVGGLHEVPEILHRPVGGIDVAVIGDVVAVVAQGRGIERHDPERRDAEIADVIEFLGQALEIADPVIRRIEERLDVNLVDDGVTVPLRIAAIDHPVAASRHFRERNRAVRRRAAGFLGPLLGENTTVNAVSRPI